MAEQWQCPKCGATNYATDDRCMSCGFESEAPAPAAAAKTAQPVQTHTGLRRISIGRVFSDSGRALSGRLGVLVIGSFIAGVLSGIPIIAPVMLTGYCGMCLSALRGESLEVMDVFDGFSSLASAFTVAFVYAVVGVVVGGLLMAFTAGATLVSGHAGASGQPPALLTTGVSVMTCVAILLLLPFYLLGYPAAADGADPIESLRFTFVGGFRNWPALIVVALIVAAIVACFFGLATLVNGLAGFLIIWVGMILLSPWLTCAMCSAYEQVSLREEKL